MGNRPWVRSTSPEEIACVRGVTVTEVRTGGQGCWSPRGGSAQRRLPRPLLYPLPKSSCKWAQRQKKTKPSNSGRTHMVSSQFQREDVACSVLRTLSESLPGSAAGTQNQRDGAGHVHAPWEEGLGGGQRRLGWVVQKSGSGWTEPMGDRRVTQGEGATFGAQRGKDRSFHPSRSHRRFWQRGSSP